MVMAQRRHRSDPLSFFFNCLEALTLRILKLCNFYATYILYIESVSSTLNQKIFRDNGEAEALNEAFK